MATTSYSDLFTAAGAPIAGRPLKYPYGIGVDLVTDTLPTTVLDLLADFRGLIPVPTGVRLLQLNFDSAELDTGGGNALDMDIILRRVVAGATVDLILYNAGTAFSAALTNKTVFLDHVLVGGTDTDWAIIGTYVNTAASTAAEGDITLKVEWRS